MLRLLPALVLILLSVTSFSQNISLNFVTPVSSGKIVSSDTARIQVFATSQLELTSLILRYANRLDTLKFVSNTNGATLWESLISLKGLRDTVSLKVIATDFSNKKDSISSSLIYAPLPTIVIANKKNVEIANPTVTLKAYCRDSLYGCTITINGKSSPDSVEVTVDLSSQAGAQLCVPVGASGNKYKQTSTACIPVFVEGNPYYEFVYGAADRILDFNFNKLLTAKLNSRTVSGSTKLEFTDLKLTNLADSSVESIPYNGILPTQYRPENFESNNSSDYRSITAITPYGAVFVGANDRNSNNPENLFDWNNKKLSEVIPNKIASSVETPDFSPNRKFVLFPYYNQFAQIVGALLRNLETGTNTLISANLGTFTNTWAYVTSSGDPYLNYTIFGAALTNIVRIKDDVKIQTTFTNQTEAVTDFKVINNKFVYSKILRSGLNGKILINDGVKDTVISDFSGTSVSFTVGSHQFKVTEKYIAFLKPNSTGSPQVSLLDTLGNAVQLGRFGTGSSLESLAPNGQVMFFNNSLRYLGDPTGKIINLGQATKGKSYFYDGRWYMASGALIFRLRENIQPNSVTTFSRNTTKDSAYQFALKDFEANFQGTGALMEVKITQLPKRGRLLLGANAVAANAVISRLDIPRLTYANASGLNQPDTLGWTGSNSIVFADNTAFVILGKQLAPSKPLLTGLDTNYCTSAGPQKVRLRNMPALNDGVTIESTLDGTDAKPASDSTITIDPSTLAAGRHLLKIKYINAAGSDSVLASFTIVQAELVRIGLKATDTLINPTSANVTITASNVSGGGASPVFRFATDRLFQNLLTSNGATTVIAPSTLSVGTHWIYVQMVTSAGCTNVSSVTDSLRLLVSDVATGLTDVDFPDRQLKVYPNPFKSVLKLKGLQRSKSYRVELFTLSGNKIVSETVRGHENWQTAVLRSTEKVYILRVFDLAGKRSLGSVLVYKKD